ncbi:nibrin [Solea senegalensis]|nr:nibrin [Solea senegalensis]
MPSVKVTIKTISALLCCCPIVKPEFFLELNKAVEQKVPLPKAESFLPVIDEPSLSKDDVKLGVTPLRKQLFAEKTFIFLSAKQLKRLSAAVGFGRGKSQLLAEGCLPRDLLESSQTCVVDATTGSSQTLLSSSTAEWANSVKNIVQRKGLRVITESEIGLAAIFASCDKYCNPSNLTAETESAPQMKSRIPSASLSQNVAVDETMLPAGSQNITAYAVNTEPPEGSESCDLPGVTAVGETPEKKQTQNPSQCDVSRVISESVSAQCIVADTMSMNTVHNTDSQRKKPESKLTVSGERRAQSSTFSTMKPPFQLKQSPRKPQTPAQTSPQKQSTLTNFFQPVNKKRPLNDEFSPVMSESKRPALASSMSRIQAPSTTFTCKETPTSQTPLGSGADLFTGQSQAPHHRVSHTAQEEPRSRKRKEIEEETRMEELESIMSEDMDFFDEQPSSNQCQQAQLKEQSSVAQKHALNIAEAFPSSKRQRVHVEDSGDNKRPLVDTEKRNQSRDPEQYVVSIKTEQVDPSYNKTTNDESSKRLDVSSATKTKNTTPCDGDKASVMEDINLLKGDNCKPEEVKTLQKLVVIKQEVQESRIDEDLPKKLLLVEFRSLTVTAPPKTKPKHPPGNGYTKNFKCFRKSRVTGVEGSAHVIAGSALLVHNKGKNSDLDEWLKDVTEEEQQSRRDETVGDDLFRYNPTKLTRRR